MAAAPGGSQVPSSLWIGATHLPRRVRQHIARLLDSRATYACDKVDRATHDAMHALAANVHVHVRGGAPSGAARLSPLVRTARYYAGKESELPNELKYAALHDSFPHLEYVDCRVSSSVSTVPALHTRLVDCTQLRHLVELHLEGTDTPGTHSPAVPPLTFCEMVSLERLTISHRDRGWTPEPFLRTLRAPHLVRLALPWYPASPTFVADCLCTHFPGLTEFEVWTITGAPVGRRAPAAAPPAAAPIATAPRCTSIKYMLDELALDKVADLESIRDLGVTSVRMELTARGWFAKRRALQLNAVSCPNVRHLDIIGRTRSDDGSQLISMATAFGNVEMPHLQCLVIQYRLDLTWLRGGGAPSLDGLQSLYLCQVPNTQRDHVLAGLARMRCLRTVTWSERWESGAIRSLLPLRRIVLALANSHATLLSVELPALVLVDPTPDAPRDAPADAPADPSAGASRRAASTANKEPRTATAVEGDFPGIGRENNQWSNWAVFARLRVLNVQHGLVQFLALRSLHSTMVRHRGAFLPELCTVALPTATPASLQRAFADDCHVAVNPVCPVESTDSTPDVRRTRDRDRIHACLRECRLHVAHTFDWWNAELRAPRPFFGPDAMALLFGDVHGSPTCPPSRPSAAPSAAARSGAPDPHATSPREPRAGMLPRAVPLASPPTPRRSRLLSPADLASHLVRWWSATGDGARSHLVGYLGNDALTRLRPTCVAIAHLKPTWTDAPVILGDVVWRQWSSNPAGRVADQVRAHVRDSGCLRIDSKVAREATLHLCVDAALGSRVTHARFSLEIDTQPALARFVNLRQLELRSCSSDMTLSDMTLSACHLPLALERLGLHEIAITDHAHLAALTHLTELTSVDSVSYSLLDHLPRTLVRCDITRTRFGLLDIEALQTSKVRAQPADAPLPFPRLQWLRICDTVSSQFECLQFLDACPNMRTLQLSIALWTAALQPSPVRHGEPDTHGSPTSRRFPHLVEAHVSDTALRLLPLTRSTAPRLRSLDVVDPVIGSHCAPRDTRRHLNPADRLVSSVRDFCIAEAARTDGVPLTHLALSTQFLPRFARSWVAGVTTLHTLSLANLGCFDMSGLAPLRHLRVLALPTHAACACPRLDYNASAITSELHTLDTTSVADDVFRAVDLTGMVAERCALRCLHVSAAQCQRIQDNQMDRSLSSVGAKLRVRPYFA